MNALPIRILVADDHFVVRFGLSALIGGEPDMEVVGEAATGKEAVELFRTQRPDVTMLDLQMPGLGGVDTIAAIRAEAPDARVIVLTIDKGDEAAYQAVRAGARGYLLKDAPSEELLEAIRAVHRGEQRIPAEVAGRIAARIGARVSGPGLSAREIELLKLVANGFSNKRIGDQLGISESSVKRHVVTILGKLAAEDRTHAVTLALERGLIGLDDIRASR